jgi:hypothetical protein
MAETLHRTCSKSSRTFHRCESSNQWSIVRSELCNIRWKSQYNCFTSRQFYQRVCNCDFLFLTPLNHRALAFRRQKLKPNSKTMSLVFHVAKTKKFDSLFRGTKVSFYGVRKFRILLLLNSTCAYTLRHIAIATC